VVTMMDGGGSISDIVEFINVLARRQPGLSPNAEMCNPCVRNNRYAMCR